MATDKTASFRAAAKTPIAPAASAKEKFEPAEIEIVAFDAEDIITSSGDRYIEVEEYFG